MRNTPAWILGVLAFLLASVVRARLPAPGGATVETALAGLRVERDPRRMCARELRTLPGVGPRLAAAILETRDAPRGAAPLAWEDVPGIGEVRARGIRAWCRAHGIEPDPLGPGEERVATSYALSVDIRLAVIAWTLAGLAGCGDAPRPQPEANASGSGHQGTTMVEANESVATRGLLGGALHALECGPRTGKTVLLLHGARFSAHTWEELGTLAWLGRAGFHAVALDWPGFGATPAWESEPDSAQLLGRVCDELGAAPVVLIAPSMSGRFAFAFATAAPQRVAALVAIAPAGVDAPPPRWNTPTLLLWGEDDQVVPLERGRALARGLPGARLEVFPGASHPCYLDQPERFHALLKDFLPGGAAAASASR